MKKGLQFRNVDLHIHTPASDCFLDKSVMPEAIVQQAIAAGMEVIAITDHNSANWVDRIKAAAQGTSLTVFAGVEITVQPGVHILAIFPETASGDHITDLLAELGLGTDSRGNPEALVTRYGLQEVIKMIHGKKALPILAHIDAPKGVWQALSGQTLIQLWNDANFAAVEIVGDSLPPEIGHDPFPRRPAYYWASDNPHPDDNHKHSEIGIGHRFSRFKLDQPITWKGLRNCFQDPKVRIQRGRHDDIQIRHPILEKITIRGGFLSELELEFLPNLNAVIGGRGTGKSSLLESLRYAFDVKANTDANSRRSREIVDHIFPPGSMVTVDFTLADGMSYRVERISGHSPRICRSGEEDYLDIRPKELLPLQVYGQKEIYEISEDPTFQLKLLDNYVDEYLKPLRVDEGEILRQLRDNAAEILHLEEDIASAEEWLSRLGAIREEILRMERKGFVSTIEQKKLYDREKHLWTQTQEQVDESLKDIRSFGEVHRLNVADLVQPPDELPNRDLLAKLGSLLIAINEDLEKSLNELNARVAQKWAESLPYRDSWQSAFDTQEHAYQELLREFQGSDDADRYIQLQRRKTELEERNREVEKQRGLLNHYYRRRKVLLERLRIVRRKKYEVRRDKASDLSTALEKVRITVHPQGHRQAYEEKLQELFAGLNVRSTSRKQLVDTEAETPEREAQRPIKYRGEVIHLLSRIPRYLDPIDLAYAIRIEQTRSDEDESILETQFSIDSDAMRRNMAGLRLDQLFELETCEIRDLPIIELKVGGGDLDYRSLDKLSVGQRCTALLLLVLLESPAPLIIDQPEDDLDNQFIFDQIVETLRNEKEKRQFIIATHNANIPVSGDAELIIVLEADDKHGQVKENGIGSIDTVSIKESVEQILEGGEEAFKRRRDKYGIDEK